MDIKEAKEIIRAGFAWANWTDEQKAAFKIAYECMEKVEALEGNQEQLGKLEKHPYVRIISFLEQRNYSYSVTDVLNGYQLKESGCYISHTMKDCVKNLESEIKELLEQ